MDGATLRAAMSYPGYGAPLSPSRYDAMAGPTTIALVQAQCTTVPRAAMMLAQIGAESGSLRWTSELASGSAYNWRGDLGNNQAGDGERFKGRSLSQITGRDHYRNLSIWAHGMGYVPTRDYFIQHPERLAWDAFAWLGPVWYWLVARPQMNHLADAYNIDGGTYAVNGGYNNLSGRTARWHVCLRLGAALLSAMHSTSSGTTRTLHAPPPPGEDMARIVKDSKTSRRYLLVGAARPMWVSAAGAAEYAALWGLSTSFPVVSHQTLVDYDARIKRGPLGVPK